MSILILGAAGNLGGQLKLAFQGEEIISWDRVDFDFLDFAELKLRLLAAKPRIIINAAAYNAVDKCESDEAEAALAWRLNSDLPACLADYCLSAAAILLHYSTDYVFGGDGRLAGSYGETDKPSPLNIYAASKLGGEKEIARRALAGLKYYLVRTSKLFGPKGANPQAKPSFFEVMLDLAATKEEVSAVDGEMSCFTYTPDLAMATRLLLEDKTAGRGIYHLINFGPATWYQGASYLFRQMGITTPLRAISPADWPRPAKRPDFSVLANNRRPLLRPWQEALDEYLSTLRP
jgi:dTDP-4-dehydrorhamnose reductase